MRLIELIASDNINADDRVCSGVPVGKYSHAA